MVELTTEDLAEFWSNVEPNQETGCWEWRGPMTGETQGVKGTPRYRRGTTIDMSARRVAYRVCFGPPPKMVGTTCGNPRCVAPGHLATEGICRVEPRERRVAVSEKMARRVIKLRNAGKSIAATSRATGLSPMTVSLITRLGRFCQEGKLEMDREPTSARKK